MPPVLSLHNATSNIDLRANKAATVSKSRGLIMGRTSRSRAPRVCAHVCTLDSIVGPRPPIPRATPSGSLRADLSPLFASRCRFLWVERTGGLSPPPY